MHLWVLSLNREESLFSEIDILIEHIFFVGVVNILYICHIPKEGNKTAYEYADLVSSQGCSLIWKDNFLL